MVTEMPDGGMYIGELIDGKESGFAYKQFTNGDAYCGLWAMGLPNGVGIYKTYTGLYFTQNYVMGFVNYNVFTPETAILPSFIDLFKNCENIVSEHKLSKMRTDLGIDELKRKIAELNISVAELSKYIRHKDVINYKDGSKYEGEVYKGVRDGFGKYTCDIYTYEGQWENDREEGRGKEIIKGELIYEGNYHKGLITEGVLTFPNGSTYKGEFFNGLPHGNGEIVMRNGDTYKGDFVEGDFTGYGSCHCSVNSYNYDFYDLKFGEYSKYSYKGEFKDFLFDGYGVLYWGAGPVFAGKWKNNRANGVFHIYFMNGTEEVCNFVDNRRDGPSLCWSKDNMARIRIWKDGTIDKAYITDITEEQFKVFCEMDSNDLYKWGEYFKDAMLARQLYYKTNEKYSSSITTQPKKTNISTSNINTPYYLDVDIVPNECWDSWGNDIPKPPSSLVPPSQRRHPSNYVNDDESSGISGRINRDYADNIDNIGGDKLHYDAYGNLVSIGDKKVEYEICHYGEAGHIKSIGGEEVEYDYITGRLKKIGNKKVHYDYVNELPDYIE